MKEEKVGNLYSTIEQNSYNLHSLCIHEGSANSGHYYTYVKDHANDVWYEFNDYRVRPVEEA